MAYTLPNGCKVYLTQRPDSVDDNTVMDFIAEKMPIARFCFCDDLVPPPSHGPTWHWLNWIPGRKLPLENMFSFFSLMKFHMGNNIFQRPIWLHCDSSSMRAPTFFGCWLRANFPMDVVKDIVAKVDMYPERIEPYYHKRANGSFLYENPIEYSDTSFKLDPGIKSLVRCWRMGGEALAHRFCMKRER